jgi:uncharacterized SAM-dependent methyltransferase
MHYYKNTELADIYGVSRRTVTNWIEQTKSGRLDLELHEYGNKAYIARTPKNQSVMKGLVQERRKFLNKRSLKTVTPRPEFYDLYNDEYVLEIISNIDTYREIPLKFSYFDGGAAAWDTYTKEMYTSEVPNTLTSTIKLLDADMSYLDTALDEYSYVNLIDVGVGNALPAKPVIAHLLERGKLKRYVAIDISHEMLTIAEKNIKQWFKGKVTFEGYVNDMSFKPFTDVVAEPPTRGKDSTVNLLLLLGGTLSNFQAPEDVLKVIRKSMGRNDLFIYSLKLDSATTREQFSFHVSHEGQLLPDQCQFILDRLNIEKDYYTVEMGYNEVERARYMQIRLKYALTLEFELSRGTWRVDLKKDDTLVVWRALHNSAFDIVNTLYENGFNPLLTSQTTDHDYMLILADLRKDGH